MSRLLWFVLGGIATAAVTIGAGVVSVMMDSKSEDSSSSGELEEGQEDAEAPDDTTSDE